MPGFAGIFARVLPLMVAMMMPGAPVADAVYAGVHARVAALAEAGTTVGLGTILVGEDPASAGYVAKKHEMCDRYGLVSLHQQIPADGSQADLLAAVVRFNADPAVDAFIIQNPVPAGFDFNQGAVTEKLLGRGANVICLLRGLLGGFTGWRGRHW